MTWTTWDILILLAFAAQVAVIAAFVVAVLRVKNGPVARLTVRGGKVAASGSGLAQALLVAFEANRDQALRLIDRGRDLVAILRRRTASPAGMSITYHSLLSALSTARTVRGGLSQVTQLVRRRGPSAVALTSGPPRRVPVGLAERLGLVPPAAKHLGKVIGFARTAWKVRGDLRRRGLM